MTQPPFIAVAHTSAITTPSQVQIVRETSASWFDESGGVWNKSTRYRRGQTDDWYRLRLSVPGDENYERLLLRVKRAKTLSEAREHARQAMQESDPQRSAEMFRLAAEAMDRVYKLDRGEL